MATHAPLRVTIHQCRSTIEGLLDMKGAWRRMRLDSRLDPMFTSWDGYMIFILAAEYRYRVCLNQHPYELSGEVAEGCSAVVWFTNMSMVFQLQPTPRPTHPFIATTQTPIPYLRVFKVGIVAVLDWSSAQRCRHSATIPPLALARPNLIQ
ncbi:hypothetical protein LY76DRAFT_392971 [Colletotrichum caudatum]|nr:hypothetical protein LY76DRAFT_392971 [Colletotrichum caudatum]